MKTSTPTLVLLVGTGLLLATPIWAEQEPTAAPTSDNAVTEEIEEELQFFGHTTITATLSESPTFNIPFPVIVIDAQRLEEILPDSATDMLRDEPGVDVNGVGPSQTRPIIRGLRGHRILFLQDGLRMNNTRRQSDFGEVTSLVDVSNIETMEVVRGAGSVLYGTDAIGGVLNLITKVPSIGDGARGSLGLRASDNDEQLKLDVSVRGVSRKISYGLSASVRDTEDYEAPSGSFGEITLNESVVVNDTGVGDESYGLYLGYRLDDQRSFFLRGDVYKADETGFGYVDPALLGEPVLNRIYYPVQDFERYTLGYSGSWQGGTLEVKTYTQNNERENGFFFDINTGPVFGPGTGPDGSVVIDSLIFSDVETQGFRLESTRSLNERNLLTYGAEWYEDDSFNTRNSSTSVALRAFFPIAFVCGPAGAIPGPDFSFECLFETTTDRPSAPNATNTGQGVFVQNEFFGDRFTATAGLRFARSEMNAQPTPQWDTAGLDFEDDDVVGSLGIVYQATPALNIVGSYATAFRSPNLIERLFNGPTPEGSGFQLLNLDLGSESSTSIDVGLKYNGGHSFFEINYFDTEIDDAIIIHTLSGDEIAALPADVQAEVSQANVGVVVQQRNSDVLTIDGIEIIGAYRFGNGVTLGGNFTTLEGKAETGGAAADPTGNTFSEKFGAHLRYDHPDGRWWAEYRIRHNGEADQDLDPGAAIPLVGPTLPSFTVQNLAGGVRLSGGRFEHNLGLVINNLTDELYAEFSNANFFRPQPGRRVITTYRLRF